MVAIIILTCVATAAGAFDHTPSLDLCTTFLFIVAYLFAAPAVSTYSVFGNVLPNTLESGEPCLQPRGASAQNSSRVFSIISADSTGLLASSSRPIMQDITLTVSREEKESQVIMSRQATATNVYTREMLRDFRCWLILWCTICVVGGGVLITTNNAQMMEAVGAGNDAAAAAVTLFAAAQSLGRLGGGIAADEAKSILSLPSAAVLVVATALTALAHYLMALTPSPAGIYAGVGLCGLGFGAIWPMMVVLTGDFFGLENLGANYNLFDGLSSALGSAFFALLLPSFAYRAHQDSSGGCLVAGCFRVTYLMAAGFNTTAVAVSVMLTKLALKSPIPATTLTGRSPEQRRNRRGSEHRSGGGYSGVTTDLDTEMPISPTGRST